MVVGPSPAIDSGDSSSCLISLTAAIFRGVRIVCIAPHTVVFTLIPASRHLATAATVVGVGAVHALLLGEPDGLSTALDRFHRLLYKESREGPGREATSLTLDRMHFALADPVDVGIFELTPMITRITDLDLLSAKLPAETFRTAQHLCKLFVAQVAGKVVGKLYIVEKRVQALNLGMIFKPVAHALAEFFLRLVVLVLRSCIDDELGLLGPEPEVGPVLMIFFAIVGVCKSREEATRCEIFNHLKNFIIFLRIGIRIKSVVS